MITVKEIEQIEYDWMRTGSSNERAIGHLFQMVRSITEHLEAQEKPCKIENGGDL